MGVSVLSLRVDVPWQRSPPFHTPVFPLHALSTLCIGNRAANLLSISQPSIAHYAESVGACFEVIRDRKFPTLPVFFEKFQIFYQLEKYDRIIYVDTDVLISRRCCNLFELVPPDRFGASLRNANTSFFAVSISWANKKFGHIVWPIGYFNSGVMVISRIHKSLFSPAIFASQSFRSYIAPVSGFVSFDQADQTLLCYLANAQKVPFHDLGDKYNLTRASHLWIQRHVASVIHYAGLDHVSKAVMMRHDLKRLSLFDT